MKVTAAIIDDGDRGAAGQSAGPPHERFDDELVMDLERDQFVVETSRPVPRAELSRRATIALWALRVFVVLVSLMVIYTFFYQLQ
jgi:hypothetical protein